MANVRQFKKDVDRLVNAVLGSRDLDLDKPGEETREFIASVLLFEREFKGKINRHKKITSASERREYFKQLETELQAAIAGQLSRLQEIGSR